MTAVEFDRVTVHREQRRSVLSDVSFRLDSGHTAALIGANGAGKTTLLLAAVAALPFDGTIRYGDVTLSKETADAIRASVGFVFSEPEYQFFHASVDEEVAFGPRQRGVASADIGDRVRTALDAVGLIDYTDRQPAALSLGEQRRLAIATAIAVDPAVLLIDEPTASLDAVARRKVLDCLLNVNASLIVATHDLAAARELGGHVGVVAAGALQRYAPADEVLDNTQLLVEHGLAVPDR